jgi:multiple sugar transport system substrate-binding protein
MAPQLSLRGMTWSHPRGYDPVVACGKLWQEKTGVAVTWDKRSLQDFESFPVEDLAARYDLIIIDHPHVGQVTAEDCLIPLDVPEHAAEAAALAAASVGRSFQSYTFAGRQWALPVDAAAQVQAWRPDLIGAPAKTLDEVMALADSGRVLVPLRPPHSLMLFFTLAANLGHPCAVTGPGDLIAPAEGRRVLGLIRKLTAAIAPDALDLDPIAVSERMAERGSTIACIPYTYGYVSYALAGFREARLAFADIPAAGGLGPAGSALGGTGIAVSARTAHPEEAIAFVYWLASGEVQKGPYAAAGGQPGHAAAWEDEAVNAPTGGFYRNTRATLEGGYVRPRHDGYMAFQAEASERINQALRSGEDDDRVLADLNSAFRGSFR